MAPIRNLVRVKEAGSDTLMTLCAMCYNTLKRANLRMQKEPENLERINNFMWGESIDYEGDVKVLHLLELLRDQFSFEKITPKVTRPLNGLKAAGYYGCLLVRPKEVGFDDMENPTILEKLMTVLGAEPVDFPYKTECCAAYQTVDNPSIVADRTQRIISSAREQGAEVVIVSCPLCAFNLDHRQKITVRKYPDFIGLPVLYFTQLMAVALGCPEESLGLALHYVDPKTLLKEKGFI